MLDVRHLTPLQEQLKSQGVCAWCGKVVDESAFRTREDRDEYRISGLCQVCIDRIFGTEDY